MTAARFATVCRSFGLIAHRILVTLLLAWSGFSIPSAAGEPHTAKLIEWGWGTPLPSYLKDHIGEMEAVPFDGLVVDLKADQGPQNMSSRFSWNVWGGRVLDRADYATSIAALTHTPFKRFTDNFLRFNVVPGRIDWFDEHFRAVVENARLAARIAKQTGLKGILFDVEQYEGKPFRYEAQPHRNAYGFEAYQQQVRRRGREFIRAINAVYPGIYILLSFGYHKAHFYGKRLDQDGYGLLPSFLDGMLEGADASTLIYDGWEFAYGYKAEGKFRQAYDLIHKKGLEQTGVRTSFRRHYRASFGLWLDYGGNVWDQEQVARNYFTPEAFERALRFAFTYTDRYVWIYSQRAMWWKQQVPQPYIDALTRARAVPVQTSPAGTNHR